MIPLIKNKTFKSTFQKVSFEEKLLNTISHLLDYFSWFFLSLTMIINWITRAVEWFFFLRKYRTRVFCIIYIVRYNRSSKLRTVHEPLSRGNYIIRREIQLRKMEESDFQDTSRPTTSSISRTSVKYGAPKVDNSKWFISVALSRERFPLSLSLFPFRLSLFLSLSFRALGCEFVHEFARLPSI